MKNQKIQPDMRVIKTIGVTLSLLLITSNLPAQKLYNYLYVESGAGFNNLQTDMAFGQSNAGGGGSVFVGVVQDQTPDFALQGGIGLQTYSSVQTLNGMTSAPDVDSDGDAYTLRTYYRHWSETNTGLFLEIPVGVLRRFAVGEYLKIVAQAGGKLSLPLHQKYVAHPGTISTAGYYPNWNVELSDIPDQGFQTTSQAYQGHSGLLPAVSMYVALGVTYPIGWKTDLFLGSYFSYGLYSISKNNTSTLYDKEGGYHGLFSSDKVRSTVPVTFGLKAMLYFRLDQRRINCW